MLANFVGLCCKLVLRLTSSGIPHEYTEDVFAIGAKGGESSFQRNYFAVEIATGEVGHRCSLARIEIVLQLTQMALAEESRNEQAERQADHLFARTLEKFSSSRRDKDY